MYNNENLQDQTKLTCVGLRGGNKKIPMKAWQKHTTKQGFTKQSLGWTYKYQSCRPRTGIKERSEMP